MAEPPKTGEEAGVHYLGAARGAKKRPPVGDCWEPLITHATRRGSPQPYNSTGGILHAELLGSVVDPERAETLPCPNVGLRGLSAQWLAVYGLAIWKIGGPKRWAGYGADSAQGYLWPRFSMSLSRQRRPETKGTPQREAPFPISYSDQKWKLIPTRPATLPGSPVRSHWYCSSPFRETFSVTPTSAPMPTGT